MDAGLSQEALAAKLQLAGWDLTRAGLSKIEARLRRVTDAELVVFSRVLQCAVGDLYPKQIENLDRFLRQGR